MIQKELDYQEDNPNFQDCLIQSNEVAGMGQLAFDKRAFGGKQGFLRF